MQLSPNFSLSEFTLSQTAARRGINNDPPPAVIDALRLLCENILEPLRAAAGKPIRISSGYRSPLLNRMIGGSATSQHCFGQAADFTIIGLSIPETVALIRELKLPVDQTIDEFSQWCHVSHRAGRNRGEFLKARNVAGKTIYTSL